MLSFDTQRNVDTCVLSVISQFCSIWFSKAVSANSFSVNKVLNESL